MYDLNGFAIMEMTDCCGALRRMGKDAGSMEEVAQAIIDHLYDNLVDGTTQEPAMVLARFFKTHAYGDLDDELRAFARTMSDEPDPPPEMKCLTLLASRGQRPEWNTREGSLGHRAIPLPSTELVRQFPMISHLVKQFGLDPADLLSPDPHCLSEPGKTTYNVFYVPEASGSPYIPAQEEFVVPYGVRTVFGFGGMLPSGDLFAVILFSRLAIPQETADYFKPLALATKVALLPFVQTVFCAPVR